jgi:hypothetical protein
MATVPIRCPVIGCTAITRVDKSIYEAREVLVNVPCINGHRFDYAKGRCPRCGHPMSDPEWSRQRAWFGHRGQGDPPVFDHAECTNAQCDYQAPKEP